MRIPSRLVEQNAHASPISYSFAVPFYRDAPSMSRLLADSFASFNVSDLWCWGWMGGNVRKDDCGA